MQDTRMVHVVDEIQDVFAYNEQRLRNKLLGILGRVRSCVCQNDPRLAAIKARNKNMNVCYQWCLLGFTFLGAATLWVVCRTRQYNHYRTYGSGNICNDGFNIFGGEECQVAV